MANVATQQQRQITISVPDRAYEVAGSVPLTVTYTNSGATPVTFREPAKTWEVRLTVTPRGGQRAVVPFGRIFSYTTDTGITRRTIEDAEDIELAPGGKYTFEYDVGARWPELFPPGVHTVTVEDVTDDDQTVESNPVTVRVLLTEGSIASLLAIAASAEATGDSRLFAARWIREFVADFKLSVVDPTEEQRAANARMIDTARAWWAAHRSDAATAAKMKQLNDAARASP